MLLNPILQTLMRASLPPVTNVYPSLTFASGRKAQQRIPRSWTSSFENSSDGSSDGLFDPDIESEREEIVQTLRTSPEQPTAKSLPSVEMSVAKTVFGWAGSLKQGLEVEKIWQRSSSPPEQGEVAIGTGKICKLLQCNGAIAEYKSLNFSNFTCCHNFSRRVSADTSEASRLWVVVPLNLLPSPRVPDNYGAIKRGRHDAVPAGKGNGVDGVGMSKERREFDLTPA